MKQRAWLLAAALGVALLHGAAHAEPSVDLNSAEVAELERLPGIGPKKAAAIVALRKKRPFSRVTQLLEVRGIGKKTLERLRSLVRVGQEGGGGLAAPRGAGGSGDAVAPELAKEGAAAALPQ